MSIFQSGGNGISRARDDFARRRSLLCGHPREVLENAKSFLDHRLAVPVMMHAGAGANGGLGTVPDIDFTSAMAAVGVFSGTVLVIRGLRKK